MKNSSVARMTLLSVLLMCGTLLAIALQGDKQPSSSRVLRSQRFILTNSVGDNIAEFASLGGEPIVILRGKAGKNKLWLQIWKDQPHIIVFQPDGSRREVKLGELSVVK